MHFSEHKKYFKCTTRVREGGLGQSVDNWMMQAATTAAL